MWELFAGIVTAIATVVTSLWTNKNNRDLTEETWARDDNAVRRRKEDLVGAGFSPTLATGSPAGNSQPIKLENPFQAKDGANLLSAIGSGINHKQKQEEIKMARDDMSHNWAVKDAQALLLDQQHTNAVQDFYLRDLQSQEQSQMVNAQINKINAEVRSMNANTKLAQQRYNMELRKFNYDTYDKYWYWNKDLPSNYSFGSLGQGVYDLRSGGNDIVNKIGSSLGFDMSNMNDMFINDFYTFD